MHAIKHFLIVVIILTAYLPASKAFSQVPTQPLQSALPEVTIFDWSTIGIIAEKQRLARPALALSHQEITRMMISEVKPLDQVVRSGLPGLTLNQISMFKKVVAGSRQSSIPATTPRLAVTPIWCNIGNYDVFYLTLVAAETGVLLAAPHFAVERSTWARYLAQPGLAANLTSRMQEMVTASLLAVKDPVQQNDTLQLQIDLARETTRADEGSSVCLNLHLAASLAPKFKVIAPAGSEMWAALRRAFAQPPNPTRATRRMVLTWNATDNSSPKLVSHPALKLPADITLVTRWAESVLGQSLGKPPQFTAVHLSSPDRHSIVMGGIEPVVAMAESERKTLVRSDQPQVAKVEGAWVYVDRGRAWGLNMDDRLVIGDGPQSIRGHVVGFFGPELGLKSPRGYAIQEGAIVFIRKGQRQTKLGMSLAYDKRGYPTPWPPVAH